MQNNAELTIDAVLLPVIVHPVVWVDFEYGLFHMWDFAVTSKSK